MTDEEVVEKMVEEDGMIETIGELIEALESCRPDAPVYFEATAFTPDFICSYRGFYEDVAISYKRVSPNGGVRPMPALALSNALKAHIGEYQTGYKGGLYMVYPDSNIWVSCHDEASGYKIQQLAEYNGKIYIYLVDEGTEQRVILD